MRITPSTLHKIAKDTVARRTRTDRDLLSVYLHGSLLEEDPLLGGTADIDLVFVHDDGVIVEREIQRLTDEVHLDIAHHERSDYRQARNLRVHPWLGPTIFSCRVLYDPHHFMDFTQASVRGQFNRPDYVLERARSLFEHARQMWVSLDGREEDPGVGEVDLYLRAVEHVGNAVASLSGPPLTERRFLSRFPSRAETIRHPGLYPGFLGLLGAPNVYVSAFRDWLASWKQAYLAIPAEAVPARLHPARCAYYLRAFEKLLDGDRPQDALWPLLRTWTQAVSLLPKGSNVSAPWQEALLQLGLYGDGFHERVSALDAYLDNVEEIMEVWAREKGAG
jgi:hypothetical protein